MGESNPDWPTPVDAPAPPGCNPCRLCKAGCVAGELIAEGWGGAGEVIRLWSTCNESDCREKDDIRTDFAPAREAVAEWNRMNPSGRVVYLVSSGEHSEHHVCAAFSGESRAKEVAELVGGDVAAFAIDPDGFIDPGLDFWKILVNRDGDVCQVVPMPRLEGYDGGRKWKGGIALLPRDDQGRQLAQWEGYAKSQEHAIRTVRAHLRERSQ